MATSQDAYGPSGHPNGSTAFWNYGTSGTILTSAAIRAMDSSYWESSGMYGLVEYAAYTGYTATAFNQYILGAAVNPNVGFTFADYKVEIDAGRPMLVHVKDLHPTEPEGHTMFAYGYQGTDTVLLYDTWTTAQLDMTWSGFYGTSSYGPMRHYSVTGFALLDAQGVATPEPGTALLAMIGLAAAVRIRKRARRRDGEDEAC